MFSKVLDWTLPCYVSLEIETKHCEHSKSSILDLLYLQQSRLVRILCQPQWVKWTTRVKLVLQSLLKLASSNIHNINHTININQW